jgi:hypothetical protein
VGCGDGSGALCWPISGFAGVPEGLGSADLRLFGLLREAAAVAPHREQRGRRSQPVAMAAVLLLVAAVMGGPRSGPVGLVGCAVAVSVGAGCSRLRTSAFVLEPRVGVVGVPSM